ncbi:methyltransferase domain-containing protein [Candidatus Peregrinibacteria bacterium]|nr:methyltransferase domain-containing protein [Candidatus Peregrinibacteria bacterium]
MENIEDTTWKSFNKNLIKYLFKTNALKTAKIAEAFSNIKRHEYLHDLPNIAMAYENKALSLTLSPEDNKNTITWSTQPNITSLTLESAKIEREQKILEIGTGTGYQAALISEIVGKNSQVVTIDCNKKIINRASAIYKNNNIKNITCELGDGWKGSKNNKKFNRIIVTAATNEISPFWIEQLLDNGLLILPLQYSKSNLLTSMLKITKNQKKYSIEIIPSLEVVGFMPLITAEVKFESDVNDKKLHFQKKLLWNYLIRVAFDENKNSTILPYLIIESHSLQQNRSNGNKLIQEILNKCLEYGKIGKLKLEMLKHKSKNQNAFKWKFNKKYYDIVGYIEK